MGNENKQTEQQGERCHGSEFSRILIREISMDYEGEFLGFKVLLSEELKISDKRRK